MPRYTVKSISLKKLLEYIDPFEIESFPANWDKLEWMYCRERPCLSGDDTFAAVDRDKKIGYVIFDGSVNWFNYTQKTPHEFAMWQMKADSDQLDAARVPE